MSIPIFFQRYRNGQQIPFQRSTIVEILGSGAVMNGQNIVSVQFSDADGGEIYGADEEEFDELSFDEGTGDKFFAALWQIADVTGALIYWLGDGSCSAVTRGDIIPQLPADIVADVGPIKIVASGSELENAIFDESFFGDD